MDLTDRVAIVTGAGQGLGRAYSRALARSGAQVLVNDVDGDKADSVVEEIVAEGGDAVAAAAPVGSSEVAQSLVDRAVDAFGRLDVLVANAGVLRDSVLWKMSDAAFDSVIDVHLRGTFTCVRAAAVRLREQGHGGRIICVGSPTGQHGMFGQSNYAGAKAGIVGMVRSWALELARAEITVNAVVPVAATAMTETMPALEPYVAALRAGEPLPTAARRGLAFGPPEDVAGLVTFLASEDAGHITGQTIGVGGDRVSIWSHPREVAAAFAEDGWSADDLAEVWDATFGPFMQPVGDPNLERAGKR